jgi:hypothetical protein
MNFLFWNLQKDNSFFDVICEIVKENSIGVVMFAVFPNGEHNPPQWRCLMEKMIWKSDKL